MSTERNLSIMSFNVEGCDPSRFYPDDSWLPLEQRIIQIATLINAIGPDLFSLQEVYPKLLTLLDVMLPNYDIRVRAHQEKSFSHAVIAAYKKTTFQFVSYEAIQGMKFSGQNDSILLQLQMIENNKKVDFVATHVAGYNKNIQKSKNDAGQDVPSSDEKKGVDQVAGIKDLLAKSKADIQIVAGDFNDFSSSARVQQLLREGFKIVSQTKSPTEIILRADQEGTKIQLKNTSGAIDFILIKGSDSAIDVVEPQGGYTISVPTDYDEETHKWNFKTYRLSDHVPITAYVKP